MAKKKSIGKRIFLRIINRILVFLVIGVTIGGMRFYDNIYKQIPNIDDPKLFLRPETSIITDRNGQVLYEIFEENRKYISYEDISPNMINAIVAMEDKRFWIHQGLDYIGIFRALVNNIKHPDNIQGGSSIYQQFVKNLVLSNEQTLLRKFKEVFLVNELKKIATRYVLDKKMGEISERELEIRSKQVILEMYLNYITFGNNAFGIQTASETYFGKSASDLTILESSILASLPKAITTYNPYTNRTNTMGTFHISDGSKVLITPDNKLYILIKQKISEIIQKDAIFNCKDMLVCMKNELSFEIKYSKIQYSINYQLGRKDIALTKLFKQKYISIEEFQQARIEGIDFKFKKIKHPISAAHFVFWIIDTWLEASSYDILRTGGLTIRTSLDLDMTRIARKAMHDNKDVLDKYGASNSAMLLVDSHNGDVLSYIGSLDYFSEEIQGQNDLVQANRQVGSTLKPFLYSKTFDDLGYASNTLIRDTPIRLGEYKPRNADGRFLGKITIKKALGLSRNIPTIRVFVALGGEDVVKPYLQSLGLKSLKDNHYYGYSIALGAGEVPMLELATAYMHLSSPYPVMINPILEVKNSDGNVLYQKQVDPQDNIISPKSILAMRDILSDTKYMSENQQYWMKKNGLKLSIKSGTSNMKTKDGDRARDGWLIGYTPDYVSIFWVGNADGSAMKKNAYGFFLNNQALLQTRERLKNEGYIQINDMEENSESATIEGIFNLIE